MIWVVGRNETATKERGRMKKRFCLLATLFLASCATSQLLKTAESTTTHEKHVFEESLFSDVRIGEKKYVNIIGHPKVPYFIHMKKLFKQTWNPKKVLAEEYSNNVSLPSQLETKVIFQVGESGKVYGLKVFHSSGNPKFDNEALRTVRESAPFPPPPEELLSLDEKEDNRLSLLFSFIVFLGALNLQ